MFKRMGPYFRPEDDKAGAAGAGGDGAGAAGAAAGGAAGGAAAGAAGAAGAAAGAGAAGGEAAAGASGGAGGAAAGETKVTAFPDNWRETLATQDGKLDDKLLGKLQRYTTPRAAIDALTNLQAKIGSGELRSALPKNATAEEISTWRKDNGIPETPDKYELSLKDGFKIPDEDKPIIDGFLKQIHGAHGNNAQASAVVELYYAEMERRTQERQEQDKAFADASQETLRADWGADYKPNLNAVKALTDMMPAEVRDLFTGGRLANGDPIMSHPGTMRWLAGLARELNPISTVVPNAGADVAGAIDTEIADIEKFMRTNRAEYNKDQKKQERLRELYAARDRAGGKKAA